MPYQYKKLIEHFTSFNVKHNIHTTSKRTVNISLFCYEQHHELIIRVQ